LQEATALVTTLPWFVPVELAAGLLTVRSDEWLASGVPGPCELTRTAVPPAAATPAAASAVTSLKLNARGMVLRPSRRSLRPVFEERYLGAGGVSVPTALSISPLIASSSQRSTGSFIFTPIQRAREPN